MWYPRLSRGFIRVGVAIGVAVVAVTGPGTLMGRPGGAVAERSAAGHLPPGGIAAWQPAGIEQDRVRATAGRPATAPVRSSLALQPRRIEQHERFLVAGGRSDCRAIVAAHPALRGRPCYLSVTVDLIGSGVRPTGPASRRLHGRVVRTGYASLTACLSGPTMDGRGDCEHVVDSCPLGSSGAPPLCYPAWDARVATEYQYDQQRALRIWLDPSNVTGYGFAIRPFHAFSLPRSRPAGEPLPIGEDVAVMSAIPQAKSARVVHVLRMEVTPTGAVRYSVR
jgi:hypothetical protein